MDRPEKEQLIMKNRCAKLWKFLSILFWLNLAAAILVMSYLGIRALAAPESAFTVEQYGSDARVGIHLGRMGFYLLVKDTSFHMGDYSGKALFGLVWGTALGYQVLVGAILWCLSSVFRRIRMDESPFTNVCCRRIRWIGLLIAGLYVYRNVVENAVFFIFGPSTARIWTSGLGLVLIGGVVLCLSCMFEYGAVLQQQADETL